MSSNPPLLGINYVIIYSILLTLSYSQSTICVWNGIGYDDDYNGEYAISSNLSYNKPYWIKSSCASTTYYMMYVNDEYGDCWMLDDSLNTSYINGRAYCDSPTTVIPTLCTAGWYWFGYGSKHSLPTTVTNGPCPSLQCNKIKLAGTNSTSCNKIFMKHDTKTNVFVNGDTYLYFNKNTFKWYCSATLANDECVDDNNVTRFYISSKDDGWMDVNIDRSFPWQLNNGYTAGFDCIGPTSSPTTDPTQQPTPAPTNNPTQPPTVNPTPVPTHNPSSTPTDNPATSRSTAAPSKTTSGLNQRDESNESHGLKVTTNFVIIIIISVAVIICCCVIIIRFVLFYVKHKQKEKNCDNNNDEELANVNNDDTLTTNNKIEQALISNGDKLYTVTAGGEHPFNGVYDSDDDDNDDHLYDKPISNVKDEVTAGQESKVFHFYYMDYDYIDQENNKNDNNELYHEKQEWEMCLMHALNALLQRKQFTVKSMNAICKELAPNKLINPHKSVLQTGNYDANVLMMALIKVNIDIEWFDSRKTNEFDLNDETFSKYLEPDNKKLIGFILNSPQKAMLKMLTRRHWIAIRQIDDIWYNLDSKLKTSQKYKNTEELNAFLVESLSNNNAELMICRKENKYILKKVEMNATINW